MSELKFMFGKPREGAHKYRIPVVDIAAVDLGLTLAVAYLLIPVVDIAAVDLGLTLAVAYLLPGSFLYNSALLLAAGVIAHRIVGVETRL